MFTSHILQFTTKLGLYPESILILLFILISLFVGPNKYYLLLLTILVISLYKVSHHLSTSLWYALIGAAFLYRGRIFPQLVMPATYWIGRYPLTLNLELLFTDLLLFLLIYLIITRRSNYETLNTHLSPVFFWLLLGLILSSGLSAVFSPFPVTSFYYFLQLTKNILLFVITLIILSSPLTFFKTKQILLLIGFLNACLIWGQKFNHSPLGTLLEDQSRGSSWHAYENPSLYRPGGFYSDPNVAASLLVVIIPPLVFSALNSSSQNQKLKWLLIIFLASAILITASRSAILVTLLSTLTLIWWYFRHHPKPPQEFYFRKSLWPQILLFTLLFLFLALPRLVTLLTAFNPGGGGTYRLAHLKIGIQFLANRPILGLGLGTFPYSIAQKPTLYQKGLTPDLPHNFLAEVGAELGAIGLILIISFITMIVKTSANPLRSHPNSPLLSYLLSYVSFIILMQFFPWFINPKTAPWFWFISAFVLVSPYVINQTQISPPKSKAN